MVIMLGIMLTTDDKTTHTMLSHLSTSYWPTRPLSPQSLYNADIGVSVA